jgi:proteasome accessory factor A
VAIRKVLGIETEYGIQLRGAGESNPIAASSMLINAYVAQQHRKVGWDFEDESPGRDARGFSPDGTMAPEVETHLVNAVLTNGARYYVDHAHPEISTPECADAMEVVGTTRRLARPDPVDGSRRTHVARRWRDRRLQEQLDGKGNSYGCHENYLMDRASRSRDRGPGDPALRDPAGVHRRRKVGVEAPGLTSAEVPFQLTQRADFFEEEVGLETTLKRPIVNTRDEPHCDSQKYRRLHVITGDANLSEIATYLKVGTTAIVLSMIEDDVLPGDLSLAKPVLAMREVSTTSLQRPLDLADGRKVTALDIQWELFDRAKKYELEHGLASVGEEVGADVLARWGAVLAALESDFMSLADQLDWVAKYRCSAYRERNGLAWNDARLRAMDLQYHDLRPEKSLFARVGMERITTDAAVEVATSEPPDDTRAYFRGRCLQRWGDSIVAANWDSLVFDVGADPLRRVPMMEPLRGTAAHVGRLIEECETAAELLDRLGS